ncbi:MAG: TlpA family protein disulfide reductase, partial [Lachnospiraceae bacterium]|nr:TlpA family protein disulfide reductase [Lachnospiraceae bacterium]
PLFQYESNSKQMDLSFLGEKLMNPTEGKSASGDEEELEKYLTMSFPMLAVYKVGADETPMTTGIYDSVEEVGSWNGSRYFILYNKSIDENIYSGLTGKDKQNIRNIIEAVPEIKKNMFVFPEEVIADNTDELKATSAFSSFSAQDVFGNEITDEIIKKNDITMINIWATWCGPCVMEMKDLGELYFNLPDGVGLISICIDSDTEAEFAKEILEKNGCEFTTLVPTGDIKDFVDEVYSFPTTIFVDRSGTVIETSADANDMEGYLSIINALK